MVKVTINSYLSVKENILIVSTINNNILICVFNDALDTFVLKVISLK